jgi:23S rRNA (uridine2552-2'-O)-methyltransferase
MTRSKSSKRWLKEHFEDAYVNRAHREGLRSRSVYKLEEIQRKDHILRPGMTVIDLGAAPGGWSEYAAGIVGAQGRIIALDILPMASVAGVETVQGDFRDQLVLEQLLGTLGNHTPDLVMSDMAPNTSGMDAVDQPRAMLLSELAAELAEQVLGRNGSLLVKVFQGEGFDQLVRTLRRRYERVVIRKPKASRPRSREVYCLAWHYRDGVMSKAAR